MKRGMAWLLGSVIFVPALLAWGADGNAGGSSERQITPAEINAHIAWTQEQREKIGPLLKARADQMKPLQEQIRQLQEQMKPLMEQLRAINEQYEQDLTALSTSDQIAAARERIANHDWAASLSADETTRHHDWASSRPADERTRFHGSATSRPADEAGADHRRKLELEKRHLEHEVQHINHELHEQH